MDHICYLRSVVLILVHIEDYIQYVFNICSRSNFSLFLCTLKNIWKGQIQESETVKQLFQWSAIQFSKCY